MYDFILPDIGEGISEALLINWSVQLGQQVEEGDEIATVSTDKVDVELPSPRAGTVAELCWEPGDTIKVGAIFMRIDTGEGKKVSAELPPSKKDSKPVKPKKTSSEKKSVPATPTTDSNVIAAPSTRKLASDLGVDLNTIDGSGPDGRILRVDIETAHDASIGDGIEREPLNSVRMVMAERMAHSVNTLAHSTMNFEIHAESFLQSLDDLKVSAVEDNPKISVTSLLVKCLAVPLSRNPRFNATIHQNNRELLLHRDVNLGVAMATERGLMVPVMRQINSLSITELAQHMDDLVMRTRSGQLQPTEMSGGTFTLSNTGGMEKATILSTRPIINAPQTATLWVSKIQNRPIVIDDQLSVGMVMNASLSFDHRFIDGADAVAFVNDFADMIENPEKALADE